MTYNQKEQANLEHHSSARPMKFVKDAQGAGWLCDRDVDPKQDLREQGCWRCDEMAFPSRGG